MSQESHDLGPTPSLLTLAGYGDGYVCPGDEVYVVSEDTDYIYRNTGANPPADGFNIIKAVFLPGIWERRNNVPAGAGVGASALRFNTVAVGAVGSGRLIDVPLAGLIDGTSLAWTESVKDTWRWDATSTLTADNITVANPIANGVNPGRFIRKLEPAPEWLQQAQWTIDPALGDNENIGTAAAPLKDDIERQRRMGANPQWGLGGVTAYDINILGDIDDFLFAGEPAPSNTASVAVKVHGNASTGTVTGVGKTVLFSGGGVGDTVVPQNVATDQAYTVLANGLATGVNPANWTALLFKRLRWISGAASGATMFISRDNGGKVGMATNTIGANLSTSSPVPVTGDTFVVEDLVQVRRFHITAMTKGAGLSLQVESIKAGRRDASVGSVIWNSAVSQSWSGCEVWDPSTFTHGLASPTWLGCWFNTGGAGPINMATGSSPSFFAGGCRTGMTYNGSANLGTSSTFRSGFQCMAGHLIVSGLCRVNDLSVFDSPSGTMIQVTNGARLQLGAGGGWNVWGGLSAAGANNVSYTFLLNLGARVGEDGQTFNVHEGTSSMINSTPGQTTCVRYDPATRIYLAAVTMSKANYIATIAGGGFNRTIVDPFGGTQFVAG